MAGTVCLTFDFDALSLWINRRQTSPASLSRGEFGAVAVPRLLQLLSKYSIQSTWFIPGHTIETYRAHCEEVVKAGHEIGLHGYLHETVGELSEQQERVVFRRAFDLVANLTGQPPQGSRTPSWDLTASTVDIMLELDLLYDSSLMSTDYTPFFARRGDHLSAEGAMHFGEATRLVELPVSWSLDDDPHFEYLRGPSGSVLPGLRPADDVFRNWTEDSRDAAQQGFYKACKTAKACRELGLDTHYPYKCKRFRTTIWKQTGIRKRGGTLLLAKAKGLVPVEVALPPHLCEVPATDFLEARLVWDRAARHYTWHLVIEDEKKPEQVQGEGVVAVDLGEIHPAALTDGKETVIIACRAMRANQQYTAKRLSELRSKQARKKKGSRRWKRLQRRTTRFLAKQRRRARDLEHKCSRAVVRVAQEREASLLVIGDVRDVADGKRLAAKSQQKIGVWAHGRLRQYLTYKAEAKGITVLLIDESYTSQTCPRCMQRYKPTGRTFRCPSCGFVAHRDAVGASNILSKHYTGESGHVLPGAPKYRYPFWGKRSCPDTAELAWVPSGRKGRAQEAAPL
jgi:IS605 OrfB family transposase